MPQILSSTLFHKINLALLVSKPSKGQSNEITDRIHYTRAKHSTQAGKQITLVNLARRARCMLAACHPKMKLPDLWWAWTESCGALLPWLSVRSDAWDVTEGSGPRSDDGSHHAESSLLTVIAHAHMHSFTNTRMHAHKHTHTHIQTYTFCHSCFVSQTRQVWMFTWNHPGQEPCFY